MKPTIGRIVIYQFRSDEAGVFTNGATEAPAVVVRVWGDTCVNLKVLVDGNFDYWKTSVSLGDQPGNWNWPVMNTPPVPPAPPTEGTDATAN